MNYTRIINEIKADHERQRQELENIHYLKEMESLGIEVIKPMEDNK